jgi:hypothetical protein
MTRNADSRIARMRRLICGWIRARRLTRGTVVNTYSEEELYRILRDYGEERFRGTDCEPNREREAGRADQNNRGAGSRD